MLVASFLIGVLLLAPLITPLKLFRIATRFGSKNKNQRQPFYLLNQNSNEMILLSTFNSQLIQHDQIISFIKSWGFKKAIEYPTLIIKV